MLLLLLLPFENVMLRYAPLHSLQLSPRSGQSALDLARERGRLSVLKGAPRIVLVLDFVTRLVKDCFVRSGGRRP